MVGWEQCSKYYILGEEIMELGLDFSSSGGKKWSDSVYILKEKHTGFGDTLIVRCEKGKTTRADDRLELPFTEIVKTARGSDYPSLILLFSP